MTDWRIALTADDVSLVLDCTDGRLPAVAHWGAALPLPDAAAVDQLVRAAAPPPLPNSPDVPVRVSMIPEARTGWTGHPGLTGSRDDGTAWSPDWRLVEVLADGSPLPAGVHLRGAGTLEFRARDEHARLTLTLVVEMLPQGLVRSRASVTNAGEADYRVDELVVAFTVPARARELLDFAGRWGKERAPQRRALDVGMSRREGRHGRPGPDSAFVLHLGTPGFGFAEGEVWAVHTAWSGNHIHYAERSLNGDQLLAGGELLLPAEGRLSPGATYAGPWVYANHGIGLDAVARRFHRWLRSRPEHPGADRPVTLNVWEAVYFDHDLDRLLALAELAASVGVERFVLDDGWFGGRRSDRAGLGDWVVSPDVWPDGLHPLVDRVTALGMQFGLWVEPEMVNPDSDLARAHPAWLMTPGGRLPVEARFQQVLNLTIPEAYTHVRDHLVALLEEYPIRSLKWDHNRDIVDGGTAPDGAPAVHEQVLAHYRLVDELKAAHPGLEIESCASGGGRIDLEVMARCDRVWASDCIDPLERQQIDRWTAQLLPPEMIGSHIAAGRSHTTGRTHDLSFRAGTAVFGHLGIEWDITLATPAELEQLAGWIAWYKAHRSLLLAGDLVRVDLPEHAAFLRGVVTPDAGVFSLALGETPATGTLGRVVLPGLVPDALYCVRPVPLSLVGVAPEGASSDAGSVGVPPWFFAPDGLVLSGAALASGGVQTPWPIPEHAVLFEVARVPPAL